MHISDEGRESCHLLGPAEQSSRHLAGDSTDTSSILRDVTQTRITRKKSEG